MEMAFVISGLVSFIFLIWIVTTANNMLAEMRIQTRQQALLLAIKRAEGTITFSDDLHRDYERYYAMKKGTLFVAD